jgi:type IV fimbrial biogenesis protein FimT
MKGTKGFTVIELMVSVVIASILLAAGIPAFFESIQRNAVTTSSNEILGSLLYARSEAVNREVNVTFTPAVNGWQVDADIEDDDGNVIGTTNLLNETVGNANITLAGAAIIYNSRGRSGQDAIEISFEGTLQSRICISLTGRPYIKSVTEGVCP